MGKKDFNSRSSSTKRSRLSSSAAAFGKLFRSSSKCYDDSSSKHGHALPPATLSATSSTSDFPASWQRGSCLNEPMDSSTSKIFESSGSGGGRLSCYLRLPSNSNKATIPTHLNIGCCGVDASTRSRRTSSVTLNGCYPPDEEVDSTNVLVSLISRADWESLRIFLSTEQGASCAAASLAATTRVITKEDNNENDVEDMDTDDDNDDDESDKFMAFHVTLSKHPPLDIVASLMRFNPQQLTAQVDSLGRTPLHVAAAYGASPQVIRFLLQQDAGAAAKLDCEGKTPLHLCCEHCCAEGTCDPGGLGGGNKKRGLLVKGPRSEVLRMLVKAFPDSLNREDEMEMSPLEHAIVNGADVRVVKLLQKLSVLEWKKTSKQRVEEESNANNGSDEGDADDNRHIRPANERLSAATSSPTVLREASSMSEDENSDAPRGSENSFSRGGPRLQEAGTSSTELALEQKRCANGAGGFCEASLLKAIVKASSECSSGSSSSGSKDYGSLPVATASLYKQLNSMNTSLHGRRGRVTVTGSVPSLRRRSSCNAAA